MSVNTAHNQYESMLSKRKRMRNFVSGGDAVKAEGVLYLSKLGNQKDAEYTAYKERPVCANYTWRTIAGLEGMLFRKAPVVEAPASVLPLLDDVTMSGVSFNDLLEQVAYEELIIGNYGVLVDYPAQSVQGMTAADAAKLNLRPSMQLYKTESIYNWRTAWLNNRCVLAEVRLSEDFALPVEKEFDAPKIEKRYRVLDLFEGKYRVRVFRQDKDHPDIDELLETIFPMMNNRNLDFIPFYFEPEVDDPPLIDLVDANLAHYRTDADLSNGLHFTGLPQGCTAGFNFDEASETNIGSSVLWHASDVNAKAWYMEVAGDFSGLKEKLDRLEQLMAILGARMLSPDKKMAETAEAAQIHRAGEESVLASIAGKISSNMTKALKTFSAWANAPSDDCKVELNREFMAPTMSPQELTALIMAVQSGELSKESLFRKLRQGDVIAAEVTFEEEQERIANASPNLSTGFVTEGQMGNDGQV